MDIQLTINVTGWPTTQIADILNYAQEVEDYLEVVKRHERQWESEAHALRTNLSRIRAQAENFCERRYVPEPIRDRLYRDLRVVDECADWGGELPCKPWIKVFGKHGTVDGHPTWLKLLRLINDGQSLLGDDNEATLRSLIQDSDLTAEAQAAG